MHSIRWPVAIAALLYSAAVAEAQYYLGPPGFSYSGGSFSYTRSRGRSSFSIGFGFGRAGYLSGPLYPYYDGPPISRLTVVNVLQAPPPVIILQPPPIFLEGLPPDILPRPRQLDIPPPAPPQVPAIPPVPGADPKAKAPEKEMPKKEDPKPKARPQRDVPAHPLPEGDARDEFSRLIDSGKKLFEESEYGRAAQRFGRAVRLAPTEPLAYFLLAQAQLAQGDYHDAHDTILAGLRRKADWPKTKFRPQELYGPNLGEYADLLRALERTHAKHKGDPVILFLRAYVLWFDGRKAQAAPLFRQALKGAAERGPIERFLAALPDEAM